MFSPKCLDVRPSDMKLYLDNCTLNRPFDDQTQPRIAREAEAVERVLERIRGGIDAMVDSSALRDENLVCPDEWRRGEVTRLRKLAHAFQRLDDDVAGSARELVGTGFLPFDALHLALAEASAADYFLTTDDSLSRRATSVEGLRVKVVNPLEYMKESGK